MPQGEDGWTKVECHQMLDGMRALSKQYYSLAVMLHCHTMIEFTGLMNEYVSICRRALAMGINFTETSGHGCRALPMEPFEAAYIGEKFRCIFGSALDAEPNKKAFLAAVFGDG